LVTKRWIALNKRILFENCEYEGNYVIQANNSTIVSKPKDLPFTDNIFDTIISSECFENNLKEITLCSAQLVEKLFAKIYIFCIK